MDILEKKKEGIMYILEKKEDYWIEKDWVKDLIPYFMEMDKIIESEKPYPSMRKEIRVLKTIKSELRMQMNRIHLKLCEPRAAYDKVFQEISRMSGTSSELEDLLESDDNFDFGTKFHIIENRYDNLDDVYGEKESDIKRKDFLRAKSAELVKAKAEILKISPEFGLVQRLLSCAKMSLHMINLHYDDRYAPSSSTKDEKGKKRDILRNLQLERYLHLEKSKRAKKKARKETLLRTILRNPQMERYLHLEKTKRARKETLLRTILRNPQLEKYLHLEKTKRAKKDGVEDTVSNPSHKLTKV